jgi:hypothetical protein
MSHLSVTSKVNKIYFGGQLYLINNKRRTGQQSGNASDQLFGVIRMEFLCFLVK